MPNPISRDDILSQASSSASSAQALERDLTSVSGVEGLFDTGGNIDYARELQKLGIENEFNSAEAQKSRDWQEYMSNTAYTRAVDDMRNAGLNPALMFGSGSSASTPSGASARSAGSSTQAKTTKAVQLLGAVAKVAASVAMANSARVAGEQASALAPYIASNSANSMKADALASKALVNNEFDNPLDYSRDYRLNQPYWDSYWNLKGK